MDIQFIKKHEGLRLNAYQDAVGVWTIGYGNTFYPPHINGGRKVQKWDKITRAQAEEMLPFVVNSFWNTVKPHIRQPLNDNQKTAIVSLVYNIGPPRFISSTLLRKLNANPEDPSIRQEFEAWRNAGGRPILLRRRQDEAALYFKK
jgi:lysozyme